MTKRKTMIRRPRMGRGSMRGSVRRKPARRMGRGSMGLRVAPRMNMKSARFGSPAKLFKDSDKDGVPNVFDCSPFNKRKQDVISPANFGGGMMDMYSRREGSRQNRRYMREVRLAAREKKRLEELERINALPATYIDNSTHTIERNDYISDGSGNWFKSDSKQGREVTARIDKQNRPVPEKVIPNSNSSFMTSLGYTGQTTATGTVWTNPKITRQQQIDSILGPYKKSGGSSGSGSSNTPKPAPKVYGPVKPTRVYGPVKPTRVYGPVYTAPPKKAPKKWYNPRSWF